MSNTTDNDNPYTFEPEEIWHVRINYHGPVIQDSDGKSGVFVGPEEVIFFSKKEAFQYISRKVNSVGFPFIRNVMIFSDDAEELFEDL